MIAAISAMLLMLASLVGMFICVTIAGKFLGAKTTSPQAILAYSIIAVLIVVGFAGALWFSHLWQQVPTDIE